MGDEGFEEWDADFLDQLIQVEELALCSTNPTQHHHPPPPHSAAPYVDISYSPPRELSQRVQDSTKVFDRSLSGVIDDRSQNVKEAEIDRLKRELGRVSKQLTHLEQECLELRKERDEKEEQVKSVFSHVEAKDAEGHCSKIKNLEYGVHTRDRSWISIGSQIANSSNDQVDGRINIGASTYKAIGVQTDKSGESTHPSIENDRSTHQCPSKLLAVWDSQSDQKWGRNIVSKLFVACEKDFHVLFGFLSLSLSSKTAMDSLADEISSDVAVQEHMQPVHSVEAAKISRLYSTLTKISNEMINLEALVEVLVDLCTLENVVIIYRSLHVLHMVLNHLLGLKRKSEKRDNVMVEVPSSGNNTVSGSAGTGSSLFAYVNETSDLGHVPFQARFFDAENLGKNHDCTVSLSCIDWVSIFELMHQIAMRNNEKLVRLEAVSIMNMILVTSDAYLEREKFGRVLVFQSVSQLLKKEAGLHVQKQAVHSLYLLLNCPQLMGMLCSGCKEEGENAGVVNNDARSASAFEGFGGVLEGLADCIDCSGNSMQELQLRRNTIMVLAFLASSGKSGFEMMLSHRLQNGTNFLGLIVRILVSEMDIESSKSVQPPDIFKERTLLIREALILLNRLVSNPQYSAPVLRLLTANRDVTCLTIDIANRLSRKGGWLWQSDSMTRQIRESEIVDLARVFKRRVFTFLGDSIL
ncbi:protein SENSITIVE TO UV 2 isoform X2 [Cornus florida]|uniref:protein SENSITIVE TO UV 2 isoform X2 n=1 Tax=Cornus florida TaxID=4283 RepID=UPI00289E790F|nr:protein SENSITIVE TO UV 2 isoform X2 [Cornus florida]